MSAHPDDMKSLGELAAEMGLGSRACPVCQGQCRLAPLSDYRHLQDEADRAWGDEKPKMWAAMMGRGVPPKIVDELRTIPLQDSDAVRAVEDFFRDPHQLLLVLTGEPQVGKSLACALGLSGRTRTERTQFGAEPWIAWRKWDLDFEWVRANQLGLVDRFDFEGKARQKRLETTKLLVIDEVGADSYSDIPKRVDELVGRRWDAALRTMMTTNKRMNQLREALGDRIVERIVRVGRIVECRDLRKGAA
jgi:hypothetical protein